MTRIPYLAQANVGRSGLTDFIAGAVFILAAWIAGQFMGAIPLGTIGMDDRFAEEIAAMQRASGMPSAAAAFGVLGTIGGVLAIGLGYAMYRTLAGAGGRVGQALVWLGALAGVAGLIAATQGSDPAQGEASQAWLGAVLGASPAAYGTLLAGFGGAILGAWGVQRWVHSRSFRSLLTAARRFRWSRVVWTLLLTWGIYAALLWVMTLVSDPNVYPNPERGRMLPFVVATLLFIPIQCAAEEIMFRGYFNQALGRFIPNALAVFAITSLAFGLMHIANPEVASAREEGNFALVTSGYVLFGFFLSLMVWIDNGLEAAIGVHTANNAWAAIFVNYEGSVLPIPGLFLTTPDPTRDGWLLLVTLGLVLGGVWLTRRPLGEAALLGRTVTP